MNWEKNKLAIAVIAILLVIVIYLLWSAFTVPPRSGTNLLNGTVAVRVVYSLLGLPA